MSDPLSRSANIKPVLVSSRSLGPRAAISNRADEMVVFACEWRSQPHFKRGLAPADDALRFRQGRPIPMALSDDLVLLSSEPSSEYHSWLRTLDLGPSAFIRLDLGTPSDPLSELVIKNQAAIRAAIEKIGKQPIYVAHYNSELEQLAANAIGAEIFGCSEDITLKYFNKQSFKKFCQELEIPIVEGSETRITADSQGLAVSEFASLVSGLLHLYPKVIVRGTEGSAGSSIYTVTHPELEQLIEKIREHSEAEYLIEPFLKTIVSPNDQWAICRDGSLVHLGISAQLFKDLKHIGNLKGQYFSKRIFDYITETSCKIAQTMAERGYRGVLGIDYIVTDSGIFPIENNARMNGSTYTLGIIERLEARHGRIAAWKFYRASSTKRNFAELCDHMGSLLYDGLGINRVFPYDCANLAQDGLFTPVIIAEDLYHIQHIENALEELEIVRI